MDALTLLAEIDAVKRHHQLSDSAIGLGALNDSGFVGRLRKGARCWPETASRVLDHLAKYKAVQTVRTADGTVIAYDPVTGVSASGRTIDEALGELRRLHAGRDAA